MNTLTPELKRAVEQAGDSPVQLMDPETHKGFVLISAEAYARLIVDTDQRHEETTFLRAAKTNARARLAEDE
jgi:hypothetical protein